MINMRLLTIPNILLIGIVALAVHALALPALNALDNKVVSTSDD